MRHFRQWKVLRQQVFSLVTRSLSFVSVFVRALPTRLLGSSRAFVEKDTLPRLKALMKGFRNTP